MSWNFNSFISESVFLTPMGQWSMGLGGTWGLSLHKVSSLLLPPFPQDRFVCSPAMAAPRTPGFPLPTPPRDLCCSHLTPLAGCCSSPISDSAGTTKLPRAHWHRRGNSLKGCSTTLVRTAHGKWRCLAWTHVFQPMQKPAHSAWVWQWAEEPRWVQFLHGGMPSGTCSICACLLIIPMPDQAQH